MTTDWTTGEPRKPGMETDWITGEPLTTSRTVREIRKKSKDYASMSEAEKQTFHTDVYVFRKVHLGIQDDAWEGDPEGKWYRPDLIVPLVRRQVEKLERQKRDRAVAEAEQMQRKGRDTVNKWAQNLGFLDLDDYCRAHKTPDGKALPWVDVYTAIMQEIYANTPHEDGILFPPRIGAWRSLANALGAPSRDDNPQQAAIRARKNRETQGIPEFNPTPEEMAESRRNLGIPEP